LAVFYEWRTFENASPKNMWKKWGENFLMIYNTVGASHLLLLLSSSSPPKYHTQQQANNLQMDHISLPFCPSPIKCLQLSLQIIILLHFTSPRNCFLMGKWPSKSLSIPCSPYTESPHFHPLSP
jgi:hypothetical protein